MEWTLVDIGKKHVIPKSQYRRKRREFFHNEDREENLKQHQDKQNIDHTTSKKADKQIHKDSIDKHERFKNSLSSHLEQRNRDVNENKTEESKSNQDSKSAYSRDHYLTDDVFKKQNSLDSVDQDTEKSKYYEQNSDATLSTKSTDKIESTDMRKLSSDKNKVGHEEQHVLSKPSEHDKETRIDFESSRTDSDSSMQTEEIKKDSSDENKSSNLKSEVISDKSNTVPKLSESDDEVNNQKPLTLPEEQKLKRQQSQNEQTKTYTYGDSEQNDKSNHENDLSHHTPSISDDKDNVMRENHIVDDNPDNDINTPSLSKTDDDRKLDEKIHVEDKHKQNADSSETVGYQSQSSASHRSTEKRNISINDHDKLNGQKTNTKTSANNNQKKATSNLNKGRATNNNYSDILKKFWMMYWPKLVILMGIIILIVILNAIFNNVNKNDRMNDNNDTDAQKYTTTMKNANNTVKSVVTVENETSKDSSLPKDKASQDEVGSGVVYKKSGDTLYIVTNAHVVGDKENQKITFSNNKSVVGKVLGKDKWSDLAVVKATSSDSSVKEIAIGDSNNLVLGEPILVVGNPLGVDFKGTVTEGIISGLNRNVPIDFDKDNKYDMLMKAFQIDASVNPGNSGGAVVNREGKLIGVVAAKISMPNVENMSFAIPVNEVQKIVKGLETKGKIDYSDVGVKMKNIASLNSFERQAVKLPGKVKNGVVVDQVDNNGLADQSGLKKGDVITELDGKLLEDDLRFRQIIFSHKDDLKSITAKIYRDGKEKEINIKLK
ncbi:TPA: trypsin-like peptidase domain-containing protein [Staphylococcus aureus]|uniref:S1C family serine protease n=1 Tax=Staphylococcus aureus TaxID=1280 RepID=UPI0009917DB4|nr:trypsin-like peptidase domain-containing protein [Staphylococcus aureus]HCX0229589.1 trypsin-like peptidase domain-containing protein [Staphylococcus aureus]HCX0841111.1 trypsin-like peptidase domain-containing protein [Staphylococcus aureus]HDB6128094.1 trypsin-like peptidase domain-containing protein [Staphylococcus aureus]HDB6645264.1 trypsin-like peptidase domain-containing protein [Staphylococcus aureus]HDB7039091.1 trypsin-like peptidase domain-containing protein [Staphylococcus aureu